MHSRRSAQRAIPATVALAFALSSGAVLAQNSGSQEVQIRGTPVLVTTDRDPRTGIENQKLQLSRNISYADLNLASPAGKEELKARVRDAANTICERLGQADPDPTASAQQQDRTNCVNNAVDDAMTQVRRAQTAAAR
jgi:UrcA family protein